MQADPDAEHPVLFVARIEVLERHLVAAFGEDIRTDLGLPELDLPWAVDDLADGYALGDMVLGYRTLTRVGGGPVAAAPDPDLSLLTLVPLSHLLRHDVAALKCAFLNPDGQPLLRNSRYAQSASAYAG